MGYLGHPDTGLILGHSGGVLSVCVTADGKHVLTGSWDKTARLWSLEEGSVVREFEGHTGEVLSVCVTADGKHVLTGSADKTARLWSLEDGALVREFKGHTQCVTSVYATADGKHVLTGSMDNTARLWSVEDRALVREFKGHTGYVTSVCTTADGKHVLTGSDDKTARLWSLEDGALVREFKGHTGNVRSVCITADGKHVLTGSADNTARLWSLEDGALVREFKGHTNLVFSVCVTADDKHVLTGSADKTARLWSLEDGALVHKFKGHTQSVTSVCATSDGKHMLTGSGDKSARLWSLGGIEEGLQLLELLQQNDKNSAVKPLIAKAELKCRSANGDTALLLAVQAGETDVVAALIAAGAEVNASNKNNDTALLLASQAGATDMVAALIAAGAEVNAPNKNDDSALILAVQAGATDMVAALIAAGAKASAFNKNGDTALLLASQAGATDMVAALIAAGCAAVNATTKTKKKSAFQIVLAASDWGRLKSMLAYCVYDHNLNPKVETSLADLIAVLNSPVALQDPHLVRKALATPILTTPAMVEHLKRKAHLKKLKDICTAQLKKLQVELETLYVKDGLGTALGGIGSDIKKGTATRQDADGLLPTIAGTGLTEDGYVHVLRLLGVSLDASFHEDMRAVLTEKHEAVAAAVAAGKEAGVEGASDDIYRAAPPKTVARMRNKLQSDHAKKKRPRPAHNLDVSRNAATYATPGALLAAYAALANKHAIVRVKNAYAADVDPSASFGYRAVLVNFIYAPSNGLTFGALAKRDGGAKGAWADHVKRVRKDQKAHAMKAVKYLKHKGHRDEPVRWVAEAQLLYRPYLAGRKKSHLFYKVLRASNSRELASDFTSKKDRAATKIQAKARGKAARKEKKKKKKKKHEK